MHQEDVKTRKKNLREHKKKRKRRQAKRKLSISARTQD